MADVREMLGHCAPEATLGHYGHHYWARLGPFVYPKLPKGSGPRGEAENRITVEHGHIRSLQRALHINEDCVKRHLPLAWR